MSQVSKLPLIGALLDRLRRRSDHESIKMAMASRGDVTKMEGYRNMADCLSRLATLEAGSGSMGRPLRVARQAHDALLRQRPALTQSFQNGGSEAVRLVYANTVAALWHLTSLLCVEAVTFVKGADGTYGAVVNRNGVEGLEGSVFVTRLEKFNESANKYGFEQTVTESAPFIEKEAFHETIGLMVGVAVTGLLGLLMLARDLAEKFYSLRGSFARWLDVQARFLEMNAATLSGPRQAARAKQEEYAAKFRALADRIRVDDTDTERQAVRVIEQDNRSLESETRQVPAYQPSMAGAQLL